MSRSFKHLVVLPCTLLITLFLTWGSPMAQTQPNEALEKAIALGKQQNWKDAIPEFERALVLDPKNQVAQANLGVAYSRLGDYKKAMLAYDAALKLGYDTADFRYLRGLSLLGLELIDEAALEIEQALKMNALMPEALYDLGLVYILQKKHDKVMALVKKLYRRNNTLSEKLFREIPPAYKIASIDNGGSLEGRVTLTGPHPKPRAFHLIHAPNIRFCSRISDGHGHRILHDFSTGPDGGLQETVIAIQGVAKGKPFPKKMQVFHIDRCHTNQYVIGVRNGEDILIENTDPIRHEIATYQFKNHKAKQTSNKPVSKKSSQIRSAFVKPGSEEFTMKCNLHPFLQTHGLFVDNPYYTVTDQNGRFEIQDIPPGTYEIIAWHPYIPTKRGTITVEPGKKASINFDFDSREERRKLYQNDTKGYRFNTWYDSGERFYGGKRVDDPVEILQTFDNSDRYSRGMDPRGQ